MKILMLTRDPRSLGGVVNFINQLESKLNSSFSVERLVIGQRIESKSNLLNLLVPLWDGVRLTIRVFLHRPDIVHINPSLNMNSLLRDGFFLFVLKIFNIRKVVVFIHGWDDDVAEVIENHVILKRLFVWLFGNASVIYILANRFKDKLITWGVKPVRVQVITTMFDGGEFDGIERRRFDNEIQILFLSRFVKAKGVYELLQAFERLSKRLPDIRLVLAGTGNEEHSMQQWVSEFGLDNKIDFTGYVRNQAKSQVFVDSDLFVLPSYYGEGLPVSVLEAMAAGLPIITSDVGGIGDFFVDGKNGHLLKKVSVSSIEKAMEDFIVNADKRKTVGEYNKKVAWEQFEATVVSKKIEKMYFQL